MFELRKLNYSYDALEPHLDAKTMEIHYSKHHQAYLDNFNKVLENYPEIQGKSAEDILRELNNLKVSDSDRSKIRNHGGGYLNHNIFWASMSPEKQIDAELVKEIEEIFVSLESFKELFGNIAKTHFGAGWAWLVRNTEGKLEVYSLPNQDSPYTLGHEPILNLDIWEHAYYLKYKNKRADFVDAWWNVVTVI
ncbi:MAG: superoxide dismutase [Candidatus Magasanikbacteria bacterium]|jgi:superoxide dismutase, Fe-Mn family|nr:superoxide dismutase [Candidatus Magasanikbacteria bacterium]MBT4314732.1 superoxide dismutase [Candidatus Magasanikbacteria bacterium]MBT4547509.1 superoxide dismutase [Candidatus Magasanikbacteria bacterium]MBT6819425.1 superoxide dismutase [Candidatus Magasanikbacteria bacterium]